MLRDLENLLNTVVDVEVREYFQEALNCYNAKSYKACVIMSVIAGVYDLHNKVKALAGSNGKYKDLDDEIENRKKDLKTYEKYLIEQCATESIDLISSWQKKELIRCLDTRNDCAHPSDFICSAEKARDIFTSMIDIVASKQYLYGCNSLNLLLEEIKENTFFPTVDSEKMTKIVSDSINKFQIKAVDPLIKKIISSIKQPNTAIQKENSIYFLALSQKSIENFNDIYVREFIKEEYDAVLFKLISINPDILNCLSDTDIERIIKLLDKNLEAKEIHNLDDIVKFITSERMKSNNLLETLMSTFMNDKNNRSIIFSIFNKIFESNVENEMLKKKVTETIDNNYLKLITGPALSDENLIKLLQEIDDKKYYEQWIVALNDYLKENRSYFEACNYMIDNTIEKTTENIWYDKVSDESKISLVSTILYIANPGLMYCSGSARSYMYKLQKNNPKLTNLFLENLFNNLESMYFDENYSSIIATYIKSSVNCANYIEKLEKLDGIKYKKILDELNLLNR